MPVHFRIAQGLVEMAWKYEGGRPGQAAFTHELRALLAGVGLWLGWWEQTYFTALCGSRTGALCS